MIGITTENGTLRIVAELPIPNGQTWGAERTSRLMAHIEQFVFAAELADKPQHACGVAQPTESTPHESDNLNSSDLVGQPCDTLPARKENFKSGLVIDA